MPGKGSAASAAPGVSARSAPSVTACLRLMFPRFGSRAQDLPGEPHRSRAARSLTWAAERPL